MELFAADSLEERRLAPLGGGGGGGDFVEIFRLAIRASKTRASGGFDEIRSESGTFSARFSGLSDGGSSGADQKITRTGRKAGLPISGTTSRAVMISAGCVS